MKKHYLFVLLSLVIYSAQSQNVGIGTNDPKSKLDINGGLSLREGPVLTLANGGASGGANDNIVLPDITAGVKAGFYRIVGPTAAFSVYGIVPVAGADGQLVTLVNTTNNAMTIKNNASSTAANGFKTLTGSDMISVAGSSSVTIQYNKTESRWYVTGSQNYVVTTGSIATGDITTGNSAITLTNNTGRLVGTGTMTVDVQNNELNKKGLVPGPTGGNGNQVWGTDNSGNPAWQKVTNSMLNTSSITVATGSGISVSGSPVALGGTVTITNTGDLSNTNEAQTISGAGTSDITLSQAGGAGGGTITLQGTGATTVSRSGNTFTINSTNSGGTVTAVTASNGLNATGTTAVDIKLGGTLTTNTTIANAGYTLGITGAGNVGIGTATPGSYKLNVQQGAANSLFESSSDAPLEIKGTDTWSGIKFTDVAASDYIWYNGGNSTFALGGGGSNVSGKKLHIHGGASVGAGYAASAVPANGLAVEGSVGIGTNTPQNTLHVNGSLRWGGSSAAPYTYSSVDPNGLYVEQVGSTAANSKIRLQTSPSGSQSTYAQLYIDPVNGFGFTSSAGGNSGFVGVGTLAPSTNLDVNGNVRIRGGSPAAGMVLTATDANGNATWKDAANTGIKYTGNTVTGNWYRIASNDGTRANAVFTLRDYISSGGHSTLTFQAGSSFNDVAGISFTLLNHNYYSTPTFTKVRILTKTTYDPQYIEVYVVRDGSVDFSITDNQQANGWVPLSWTAGSLPSGYTANEYEINTLFNIGNNDDRFTVTRTGNVGIGTPTPVSNLQVTGSTTAAVTVSSSNYPATYKTQLGAQAGAQGILVLGNNAANEIRFGNTAAGGYGSVYVNNTADYNSAATGTLAMFYKADGNVGIGNANPVDKLDVTGHITLSGGSKEIRFRNGAGTVEQYVWHSGTSLGLGAGSGSNSMFITAAGNVGVGTGSPNGKFHINTGGASGVGWGTGFNIGDASNYSGLIQDAGVSRWRNYGTGGYDWYSSGGTQLLALSNAGTLGIRGGSPAADKILTSTNSSGDAVWSNAIRVKPTTESF
ncbi:MAG TPA: hypothetical protein VK174_14885, partial [Chitinophagales bacterium]|nr:hypothetical protein [Chitinophagales bacterium]